MYQGRNNLDIPKKRQLQYENYKLSWGNKNNRESPCLLYKLHTPHILFDKIGWYLQHHQNETRGDEIYQINEIIANH